MAPDKASEYDQLAERVRADVILALSSHLDGPRGDEAADHILILEGVSR